MLLDRKPLPPGFTHESTPDGVRIVVPAVKNAYVIVGVPLLVVVWTWAVWAWVNDVRAGAGSGFGGGIKIIAGTAAILFCLAYWLWTLLGREVFLLQPDALQVSRRMLGLEWTYRFPWDEICDVRFRPEQSHVIDPWFHEWSALLLEHGGRTYAFARDLDGMELDQIIALIKQHMPLPVPTGEQMFRSLP